MTCWFLMGIKQHCPVSWLIHLFTTTSSNYGLNLLTRHHHIFPFVPVAMATTIRCCKALIHNTLQITEKLVCLIDLKMFHSFQ